MSYIPGGLSANVAKVKTCMKMGQNYTDSSGDDYWYSVTVWWEPTGSESGE